MKHLHDYCCCYDGDFDSVLCNLGCGKPRDFCRSRTSIWGALAGTPPPQVMVSNFLLLSQE